MLSMIDMQQKFIHLLLNAPGFVDRKLDGKIVIIRLKFHAKIIFRSTSESRT